MNLLYTDGVWDTTPEQKEQDYQKIIKATKKYEEDILQAEVELYETNPTIH